MLNLYQAHIQHKYTITLLYVCSVTKSCPALCNPVDCSTLGFLILHSLLAFGQIHVYWISSSVVPFSSCPQSFPASGSFPISQLLHQVAEVLELQLSAVTERVWWGPAACCSKANKQARLLERKDCYNSEACNWRGVVGKGWQTFVPALATSGARAFIDRDVGVRGSKCRKSTVSSNGYLQIGHQWSDWHYLGGFRCS